VHVTWYEDLRTFCYLAIVVSNNWWGPCYLLEISRGRRNSCYNWDRQRGTRRGWRNSWASSTIDDSPLTIYRRCVYDTEKSYNVFCSTQYISGKHSQIWLGTVTERTLQKCYPLLVLPHVLIVVAGRSYVSVYVRPQKGPRDTRWHSWLSHCATSRKVEGSIPFGVFGIFHWHNPSSRTMALGLTQPLREMSTSNISWGVKAAGA